MNDDILAGIPNLKDVPAVALETTVLTHGMPYPQNVECALQCEEEIRKRGAKPFTIGIIDGKIKVGLTQDEIKNLGKKTDAIKVSRRDIAYCIQRGLTGSTTVAATMIIAHMAGVKVFATGGIGGVHRGYADTLDVSADLEEFSRTPVHVICAGPKAILDVPKTMEYLETKGVPVVGYNTSTLPLFYSRTSDIPLDIHFDDAKEIAQYLRLLQRMDPDTGALIVNPVPEEFSIPADKIDAKIEEALGMMKKEGITGKRVTPYLLDKLVSLTGGDSLRTNMALIKNNSALAAMIAVNL